MEIYFDRTYRVSDVYGEYFCIQGEVAIVDVAADRDVEVHANCPDDAYCTDGPLEASSETKGRR